MGSFPERVLVVLHSTRKPVMSCFYLMWCTLNWNSPPSTTGRMVRREINPASIARPGLRQSTSILTSHFTHRCPSPSGNTARNGKPWSTGSAMPSHS